MDRNALRLSHPLHGVAEPERIGARDLDRADVVHATAESGQAVGAQGRLPPSQSREQSPDRCVAEALLDRQRRHGAPRQVLDVHDRYGRQPLLHPRGFDGSLQLQPGPAQHVSQRADR